MKRSFDFFVSLFLLLMASPFMLACAIAIRLDSSGPVLYRQQRVGRYGRAFHILKFRSMVSNADRIGSYSTVKNDARITRVGSFLRRTSLDELPQLMNVLRGDMSLVGPRPDVPEQQGLYNAGDWAKRLSVRPGITGLAQATLRSAATFDQRLALDLHYVEQASFMFDLKILVQTLGQVVSKGSY